ncbi:MAG: hypothetical protein TEF_04500 [Rhizobiales bacterium NRL2]|jgi:hypothetical protein|nr:MAG: hypothetical protein TEF_04500 [Rhizobiales bacterium NRL2]
MKVEFTTLYSEQKDLADLGDTELPESVRDFAGIWRRLKGERPAPAKADIEPTVIPPKLLPNIMLWDVLDDDYRVRLAGTGYRRRALQELSGQHLSEVYGANSEMREEFDAVAKRGRYSFIEQRVQWAGAEPAIRTRLLLPLSMEDGVARHLVGFIGPGFRFELGSDGDARRRIC